MTGRSDYGSRAWVYPALLSYAQTIQTRRGAQQDICDGLRRLLGRPVEGRQALRPAAAPAGNSAGRPEVSHV